MKFFQPVVGTGQQEVFHLVTAKIEYQGAPVRMLSPARIGVFVQSGAIELAQGVGIARKMRRHPVEDDANTPAMQVIDKEAKVVRRAKTTAGREISGRLVTPGHVQRVLGNRQQFHVGEAQLQHIIGQLRGDVPVVEKAPIQSHSRRASIQAVSCQVYPVGPQTREAFAGRISNQLP
jgi:hypothetical protein